MVVMLENKGYAATLGTCSADPYLCSLASSYASVQGWNGVSHPSLPNYLAIDSGSTQGVTSDCTSCGPFTATDLGGQLSAAHVPWAGYMESMPTACSTIAGDNLPSMPYAKKHNPFVYFSDVLGSTCAAHVLPYTSGHLSGDLNATGGPDFAFVTPNLLNDMHSGSVATADAWLKTNVAPVLASPWFTGGHSTVIITMDENSGSNTGGGGPVPMVVISSAAAGKGQVAVPGNHYGLLRTIEELYGLPLLGDAGNAANGDLRRLFG
jgi:phosphatidylinositol-3-phosphatase